MTRSEMMGRIGPRDTKPEMIVRRGLHHLGFRFRLHKKELAGRPDIVLPKYRAVIFINGCFWHAHEGCSFFRLPKTRTDFWKDKLARNKERDKRSVDTLLASGWRVLTVWECATRSNPADGLVKLVADWLQGNGFSGEIPEKGNLA